MAGRRRRIFSRKKKDLIWIPAVAMNVSLAAGATQQVQLVQGSDWADASTGFERAKLLSIRGWMSAQMDYVTANARTFAWAIGVMHETATFADLGLANSYLEDILVTGGKVDDVPVTEDMGHPGFNWDINVKAKRNITSEQIINLGLTNRTSIGSAPYTFSVVVRCLIQRD